MSIISTVPRRIVTIEGIVGLSISLSLSFSISIGISAPFAIDKAMSVVATVPGRVIAVEGVVSISVSLSLSISISIRGSQGHGEQGEKNLKIKVVIFTLE